MNLYNDIILSEEEKGSILELTKRILKKDNEELTELEIETALFEARREKAAQINLAKYKERVFTPRPIFPHYTAEEYFDKLKNFPGFSIDKWNTDLIWELCYYFSQDERGTLDRNKGIYIQGPVGCGKTTLMEFFCKNHWNSYVMASCITISEMYQQNGVEGVKRFKNIHKTSIEEFGQTEIGTCFDDLGREIDKNNWGNISNVMYDLIISRYNNKKIFPARTHVTTNFNPTELETKYGYLVRSRLREICNVLKFDENAPDRRK